MHVLRYSTDSAADTSSDSDYVSGFLLTMFLLMLSTLKKHKDCNFLLPCSDILKDSIPQFLKDNKFKFTKAVMYRTVCSDLSDLENVFYDILVFYSPSGIKSLYQNFPDFEQNETRIAAFGPTTAKAVDKAGLELNIGAPSPKAPSMTMALEQYIKKANMQSLLRIIHNRFEQKFKDYRQAFRSFDINYDGQLEF